MAYVKTVRVVYTKGIDAIDPFMLAGIVKKVLNRQDRQTFEQEYPKVTKYAELVALCERFVELDSNREVGTEPEYGAKREVYNDIPDPWRKLLWDTMALLVGRPSITAAWDVMIGNHDYRGPSLWLKSLTMTHTSSPSIEIDTARHSSTPTVKMRTYPGLALNTTLEKATPEKLAAKLIEHGEKVISKHKIQTERETEQQLRQRRAAKLVALIEQRCGIPRYYDGSRELELTAPGATLRITPNSDYGTATLTLSIHVGNEAQIEKLKQSVELVKTMKASADLHAALKKEAK